MCLFWWRRRRSRSSRRNHVFSELDWTELPLPSLWLWCRLFFKIISWPGLLGIEMWVSSLPLCQPGARAQSVTPESRRPQCQGWSSSPWWCPRPTAGWTYESALRGNSKDHTGRTLIPISTALKIALLPIPKCHEQLLIVDSHVKLIQLSHLLWEALQVYWALSVGICNSISPKF